MKVKIVASVPLPGQCDIDFLIGKTFAVTNRLDSREGEGFVQIEVTGSEILSGAIILNKNEYEVSEA